MQNNPPEQYGKPFTGVTQQESKLSTKSRIWIYIGVLTCALLLLLLEGGFPATSWRLLYRTLISRDSNLHAHEASLLIQSFLFFVAWLLLLFIAVQVSRNPSSSGRISKQANSISQAVPAQKQTASPSTTTNGEPERVVVESKLGSPWRNTSWTDQSESPLILKNAAEPSQRRPDIHGTILGPVDVSSEEDAKFPNNQQQELQQGHAQLGIAVQFHHTGEQNQSGVKSSSTSLSVQNSLDSVVDRASQEEQKELHAALEARHDLVTVIDDLPPQREEVEEGVSDVLASPPRLLTVFQNSSRGKGDPTSFKINAIKQAYTELEGVCFSGWTLCYSSSRTQSVLEDCMLVIGGVCTQVAPQVSFGLFILSDGSLLPHGADGQDTQASTSRTAIQALSQSLLPALWNTNSLAPQSILRLLTEGMQSANQCLYTAPTQEADAPVVTMTAVLVLGTAAYVTNVGDNRVYLYHVAKNSQQTDEGLFQITNDHSSVSTELEQGRLTPEEVYARPKEEYVYRTLGRESSLTNVDVFPISLTPGDYLLLCSDGLWKNVPETIFHDLIERTLRPADASPSLLCPILQQAALGTGGHDHSSTMLVQILSQEEEHV